MTSGGAKTSSRAGRAPDVATVEEIGRALSGLGACLDGVDRLGVAYSGGVDSAVLLAAAVRLLGADRVIAVLGVSPSLATDERRLAHEVAAVIGAPVVEVETREGDRPEYRANDVDRCFHCKDQLFSQISDEVVQAYRLDAVAYGENADDAVRIDRPGARAATDHRVLRPLAEVGLTKVQVRALARAWELPCADKPAAPCLASRIPHHQEVTPEKLVAIDRAEQALRELGFADFRVRHHGEIARLELPADALLRAVTEPVRTQVNRAVRQAGFRYAVVDLAGMQSGAFTLVELGDRAG